MRCLFFEKQAACGRMSATPNLNLRIRKRKRSELVIANTELAFQNEQKKKCSRVNHQQ
jgi:hypothetical protein